MSREKDENIERLVRAQIYVNYLHKLIEKKMKYKAYIFKNKRIWIWHHTYFCIRIKVKFVIFVVKNGCKTFLNSQKYQYVFIVLTLKKKIYRVVKLLNI